MHGIAVMNELLELGCGTTAENRLAGQLDSTGNRWRGARHVESGAGVGKDDVVACAARAGEHLARNHSVPLRIAAGKLLHRVTAQADLFRGQLVAVNLPVANFADARRRGDGDLVQPVVAVNDESVARAESAVGRLVQSG